MCNRFRNEIPYDEYRAAFSSRRIPVRWPEAAPNLEPCDIRPTDRAPVIRQAAEGVEFAQLRWGFAPARPKAGPVINFRSEGRRFSHGRCLVPASCFYEFTGTSRPKTMWRFSPVREPWFCFAGIWRPGASGDAFTLLTTSPGEDVRPFHDRQMVIIAPADWHAWLSFRKPEEELLRPLPPGSLAVEQVR